MAAKPKAKPRTGRPSKYTPKIQALADGYLEKYIELGHTVPSAAGLSIALDVSRSTIQLWGEQHSEFSVTLGKIMAVQEIKLLSCGLTGDFNSTIAKLMLHNHGYSDKLAVGGDEDNPLRVQSITRTVIG